MKPTAAVRKLETALEQAVEERNHARELAEIEAANRERAVLALRALLPLLGTVGYTSPEQQAAIREARAIAAESKG